VGAFGIITQNKLLLKGFVGSEDGQTVLRGEVLSDPREAENAGLELARKLISRGALGLLKI